jgi:hypothetical protein
MKMKTFSTFYEAKTSFSFRPKFREQRLVFTNTPSIVEFLRPGLVQFMV